MLVATTRSTPIARPELAGDAELARLDDHGLVLALAMDRIKRRQYEAELQAALAGCLHAWPD
jgi:hypothetical protein